MCVRYGRSQRGHRVVFYSKKRGKRYTLIAAMGANGPVAKHMVAGGMKRADWAHFLAIELLPLLPSRSIIAMDNLNLHREDWVEPLVRAYGCAALYLPPYSPETNPIELMFNVLKSKLRAVSPDGLTALRNALEQALESITSKLACAFFAHCGLPCPSG
jgi:transposase